jgi:hypothetical protein
MHRETAETVKINKIIDLFKSKTSRHLKI